MTTQDRRVPAERAVPGPGQESVWDYPRPPRVEPETKRIRVVELHYQPEVCGDAI